MISQHRWADLTVRAFFQDYNWSGEDRSGMILEECSSESETVLHLGLTVATFLQHQNWQGLTVTPRRFTPQVSRPLSLAMPVAVFMRGISWAGSGAIAPLAREQPKTPITDASPAIHLNQFSDLF